MLDISHCTITQRPCALTLLLYTYLNINFCLLSLVICCVISEYHTAVIVTRLLVKLDMHHQECHFEIRLYETPVHFCQFIILQVAALALLLEVLEQA